MAGERGSLGSVQTRLLGACDMRMCVGTQRREMRTEIAGWLSCRVLARLTGKTKLSSLVTGHKRCTMPTRDTQCLCKGPWKRLGLVSGQSTAALIPTSCSGARGNLWPLAPC
jgi:hypothetical protein